jgi:hypothetical protein
MGEHELAKGLSITWEVRASAASILLETSR